VERLTGRDLAGAQPRDRLCAGLRARGLCRRQRAARVERVALGWLAIAVVVCLYAFGGKALPGVHVGGLFNLNHADILARLRAPLGYWNALAFVLVLAIPIAVRVAVDSTRRDAWRLAALFACSC